MTAAGQHLHKTLWGLDASWREPLCKGQARCTRSSIHNRKCINAEHKPWSFLWAWTERAEMKFTHPKFCEREKLKQTFCRLLSQVTKVKKVSTPAFCLLDCSRFYLWNPISKTRLQTITLGSQAVFLEKYFRIIFEHILQSCCNVQKTLFP